MSGESGESSVPSPQSPGKVSPRPRFTDTEMLLILGERELRIEERERAIANLQEMLRAARDEAAAAWQLLEKMRAGTSIPPDPLSPTAGAGGDGDGDAVAGEWGQIVRERMAEYSTVEHAGSTGYSA